MREWSEVFCGRAAWMCLCRDVKEIQGRWLLGLGTRKGSDSWCPECAGTWRWEASKWAWGS